MVGGGPWDFSVTPVPIGLGFLGLLSVFVVGLGELDLGLRLDKIHLAFLAFTRPGFDRDKP